MQFTQFRFPDGQRRREIIDMPDDVEALASELLAAGWSFEIECFPDSRMVHADCCDDDEPIADEMCPNGPEVPTMIERLVRSAHAEWIRRDRPKAKGNRATAVDRDEAREMAEFQ